MQQEGHEMANQSVPGGWSDIVVGLNTFWRAPKKSAHDTDLEACCLHLKDQDLELWLPLHLQQGMDYSELRLKELTKILLKKYSNIKCQPQYLWLQL